MSGISSIFGSSGAAAKESTPAANLSSADIKKQVQDQIAQELAVTNATELVNKITENCFQLCFKNPGTSVSGKEQACTKQCMEKYMHSWNLISRSYISRIQQASSSGQI